MKKIDFAAIEHAEHELAVAREKVHLLKKRAVIASPGWKIVRKRELVRRRLGPFHYEWKEYLQDPVTGRMHWSVFEAFENVRRRARVACGPTSCERQPLGGSA